MNKYTRGIFLSLSVFGILALISCEELEDEPAELVVTFQLETAESKFVQLEEFEINLEEFSFDGERESGPAVSFRGSPESSVLSLQENDQSEDLKFNIPQGIYTRVKVDFSLESDADTPSVRFTGKLRRPQDPVLDTEIIFEYHIDEIVELIARSQASAVKSMVVERADKKELYIKVDAGYWFQPLTASIWQKAVKENVGGVEKIVINAEHNEGIYQMLGNRFRQSVSAEYN